MRALWLPDVLRSAGLTVRTYPGWETRGSASWGPLRGVICHATAGSRTSTDDGEMRVLWEVGSTTAPVPISQCYLSRSGVWTVGASGLCYHALIGQIGPHRGYGNTALLGVEAANDNRGEPWPAVQLDSYQRGVAAICRHMGWDPSRAVAHREHQTDKTDPYGVDMLAFRRRVAELLAAPEEDSMAVHIWMGTDGHPWAADVAGGTKRQLSATRDKEGRFVEVETIKYYANYPTAGMYRVADMTRLTATRPDAIPGVDITDLAAADDFPPDALEQLAAAAKAGAEAALDDVTVTATIDKA